MTHELTRTWEVDGKYVVKTKDGRKVGGPFKTQKEADAYARYRSEDMPESARRIKQRRARTDQSRPSRTILEGY